MKKLRLELDDLAVESFRVDGKELRTGTVIGRMEYTGSCPEVCGGGGGGGGTNLYECNATVHYSCDYSCHFANSCDTTCP
ncbi:MAG TPA: hypothetical protein VJT67_17205 [Longimicrobiaceae bacterium]|nr:hypothetical protein [Longimicrobiaceae bacterium]